MGDQDTSLSLDCNDELAGIGLREGFLFDRLAAYRGAISAYTLRARLNISSIASRWASARK
jgi:hypothetical protein